jgi:hypothetical protein
MMCSYILSAYFRTGANDNRIYLELTPSSSNNIADLKQNKIPTKKMVNLILKNAQTPHPQSISYPDGKTSVIVYTITIK